jgi:hypothetical protein
MRHPRPKTHPRKTRVGHPAMQEKCPEKLCLSFWFEVKWDLNPHPFAKPAKGWGTRMMVMLWRQDAGVEVLRRVSQSPAIGRQALLRMTAGFLLGELRRWKYGVTSGEKRRTARMAVPHDYGLACG